MCGRFSAWEGSHTTPIWGGVEDMSEVVVGLNQQQLELVDKTVEWMGLASREELLRLAVREFFEGIAADSKEGQ